MFTIDNQGANSYLTYKLGEDEEQDSLSLGMLTNNKITGFAPVIYTQCDKDKFLKYNITSRVPLKQVFSSVISRDRLLSILIGIIDAIIVSDDYMLAPGSIMLDINYIYVDVSNYSVELICLPIMDKDMSDKDVRKFFKQILFDIRIDQNENMDYLSKILSYLNMGNEISLSDLKLFLLSFKPDAPVALGMSGVLNASHQQAAATDVQRMAQAQPEITPMINEQKSIQLEKQIKPMVQNVNSAKLKKNEESSQLKNVQIPSGKPLAADNGGFNIPGMPDAVNENKTEKKKSFFSFFGHKEKKNETDKPEPKKKEKEKKHKEKNVKGMDMAVPGMNTGNSTVQGMNTMSQTEPTNGNTGAFRTMPLQSMGGAAANFGETTVLNSGSAGETTVLSDLSFDNSMPFLVRMRNNERIYIDKPVFRIGKERNYVDYFISDNTAVSRSHADIISKNGSYYVEDMNSTNHTYINGTIIHSGVQVPIKHGDKVMFANEEYEFRTN